MAVTIKDLLLRLKTTGTKKAESQLVRVENQIKSMIVAGLGIYGVKKAFSFSVESVKMSAQVEKMRSSFDSLTESIGMNARSLETTLDMAFKGTMKDYELLRLANNALLLGLPLTEESFGELAEAGRRLGEAVGQDARYGFESLVTGIGRQSRLMLDNVGIIVDTTKAYKDYAKQIGVDTVTALTDVQKKQAFFNATMDSVRDKMSGLGKDVDDTNTSFKQLQTTFDDFKITLGAGLSPAIQYTTEGLTALFWWLNNGLEKDRSLVFKELADDVSEYSDILFENKKYTNEAQAAFEAYYLGIDKGKKDVEEGTKTIWEVVEVFRAYVDPIRLASEATIAYNKNLSDMFETARNAPIDIIDLGLEDIPQPDMSGLTDEIIELGLVSHNADSEIVLMSKSLFWMNKRLYEVDTTTSDALLTNLDYVKSLTWMEQNAFAAASAIRGLGSLLDNENAKLSDWLMGIGGILGMIPGMQGVGGGFSIAGAIGGVLGFADGGEPPINRPSIVGERGPELFVPKVAGNIIPNDQLGGGVNITINGDFLGTEQQADKLAKIIAQRSGNGFNNIAVKA